MQIFSYLFVHFTLVSILFSFLKIIRFFRIYCLYTASHAHTLLLDLEQLVVVANLDKIKLDSSTCFASASCSSESIMLTTTTVAPTSCHVSSSLCRDASSYRSRHDNDTAASCCGGDGYDGNCCQSFASFPSSATNYFGGGGDDNGACTLSSNYTNTNIMDNANDFDLYLDNSKFSNLCVGY